jgi:asparagine synthetase B (glutamine-hydrolysing)
MCGIAGVVDPTGTRSPDELACTVRRMAETLRHRGVVDDGVWADAAGGIALGFWRLSVVDPGASGSQPMWSPSGRYGKRILRQVLDRYVPRQLVDRPKMGFDLPITAWLRGPLREWTGDLLEPHALAAAGINPVPVRRTWAARLVGTPNRGHPLWTVLMYQAWRETL